jgi:carbonic anhydrase
MFVSTTEHERIQPIRNHDEPGHGDVGRSRARPSRIRGILPVGLACLAALAGCHKQPAAGVHHPGDSAPDTAGHAGQEHAGTGHGAHWSYEGDTGPVSWGELATEYATCGQGRSQSPVDLPASVPAGDHHIAFHYQAVPLKVINNGHTIQVEVPPGSHIELDGKRYDLRQFHFHHPSEESVAGKRADMVAHLVHIDAQGAIAVVGVLMNAGATEPAILDRVWQHLPAHEGETLTPAGVQIELAELLPAQRQFYHFTGSLTTPPCSEGVAWNVMAQPITIKSEHVQGFHALYPVNARPVQPLNGRVISSGN